MDEWTVIRFLHVAALAFFVGGQLVIAIAVAPALRGGDKATMRSIGRRFGIASAVALAVLIATGVALAGRLVRWDDPILHAKLALLVLIAVLVAFHVITPYTRAVSIAILLASLAIVWLGVRLTHG